MIDVVQFIITDLFQSIISLLDILAYKGRNKKKSKNQNNWKNKKKNKNKMSDSDNEGTDMGHPDSAIRLASAVHRFKVPTMDSDSNVSFAKSFKSVGQHSKTRTIMLKVSGIMWGKKKLEHHIILLFCQASHMDWLSFVSFFFRDFLSLHY